MKIAANKFFDVTARADLDRKVINSTCVHDGRIYIGTDTGLQITNTVYVPVKNELSEYIGDTRVRCIMEDNEGNLWLSTFTNDKGLVCYTADKRIISFTEADGLPNNRVRCTCTAPDGAVLAGTNNGLAVIRNGKIERVIDQAKGLSNPVILTVEADDDGKIYMGSDGDGIYVADGSKITHLYREDGLTSGVILRIKKDEKRNVIWIVTSNSIQYIQDGVIKKVENFPYTNNYDIYFDSKDKAWVLASSGIYVASAQDMLSGNNFDYVFYNVSDGLPSMPTSNSFSCLDENGDLFMSCRSGVTRVNIDDFFVESHDIRFSVPYIEDSRGRYYPDENNTFSLPPTANNITIYSYALTFMMHDPQIEYFLDGADTKPIVVNKSDMAPARYTNLHGGEYDFSLSLIDNASHTVRQTVSYHIVKERAFYEQWWFYVLASAAVIMLIVMMIRIYLRRKTAVFVAREKEQQKLQRLFEQTATALVNAIDAKDKYTHGHSSRVAEYSKKIAALCGMDEKQCLEVYYAGLLHDVGKIGVPASVINKDGRLTDEEYEMIKQHPVTGYQILRSIREYPFLGIGARYHHERYDGKGYPDGLKGTDIPEIARIVSVADAYDAMTSKRSYRDPIPQQKVREEFVKGSGTQFDPEYAKMMLHLIDLDTEYEMKEREEINELDGSDELIIGGHRSMVSDGILLTPSMTEITLRISRYDNSSDNAPSPSLVLFDSLDGRVHDDEKSIKDLLYFEYGEIWLNGHTVTDGARKMKAQVKISAEEDMGADEYRIEAAKFDDHAIISITSREKVVEVIAALPDSARFVYLGLTGEYCRIGNVRVDKTGQEITEGFIPRIAEKISYIDVPEGDLPNVQIDGYRTASTIGLLLSDSMQVTFHTMSLPTARLVWHCPYIDIFYSDDGKINGANYRDFTLMRLDGEYWECDGASENTITVNKSDSFEGWEAWKKYNKAGFDCKITLSRDNDTITAVTENFGLYVKCVTKINDGTKNIYAALTGDQCAITNIRVAPVTSDTPGDEK